MPTIGNVFEILPEICGVLNKIFLLHTASQMTSHALCGIAGIRWTLHAHRPIYAAACSGRWADVMAAIQILISNQKSDFVSQWYLLEEQSGQISSRSDLKRRNLRPLWRSSSNKN